MAVEVKCQNAELRHVVEKVWKLWHAVPSNLIRISARDPMVTDARRLFEFRKKQRLGIEIPAPPRSTSDVEGASETPQLIDLPFKIDSTMLLGYQALLKDAAPAGT